MTTAHIDSICAACKREWPIELAQEISGKQLRWSEQFACECGHGFQANGVGLPSEGIRRALLAEHGSATTWIDAMKSKPHVVAALVALTGVSEAEAAKLVRRVPAKAYVGTPVEAQFVSMALTQAGAVVRVVSGEGKKKKGRKG